MDKPNSFSIVVRIVVAVMLLLATAQQSSGFYLILRVIVFVAAVYLAYKSGQERIRSWSIIFIVIAVLFNPFLQIFLLKALWQLIDVVTAIVFVVSLTQVNKIGRNRT